MKKLKSIVALVLLTSFSQVAFSQTTDSAKLKFGVKGGVNFSNLYTEDVDDSNLYLSIPKLY